MTQADLQDAGSQDEGHLVRGDPLGGARAPPTGARSEGRAPPPARRPGHAQHVQQGHAERQRHLHSQSGGFNVRKEVSKLRELFTRVTDKHVCFFYIQPSPKQRTILVLISHVPIFEAMTHRYAQGINEV